MVKCHYKCIHIFVVFSILLSWMGNSHFHKFAHLYLSMSIVIFFLLVSNSGSVPLCYLTPKILLKCHDISISLFVVFSNCLPIFMDLLHLTGQFTQVEGEVGILIAFSFPF